MVNVHKEKDDSDADNESHQSSGATKRRGLLFLHCLGADPPGVEAPTILGERQLSGGSTRPPFRSAPPLGNPGPATATVYRIFLFVKITLFQP